LLTRMIFGVKCTEHKAPCTLLQNARRRTLNTLDGVQCARLHASPLSFVSTYYYVRLDTQVVWLSHCYHCTSQLCCSHGDDAVKQRGCLY
jgi:hypothetical protein